MVISVRNPRLPKLTPRTGTGRSTRWLAARSVPSPPMTTRASAVAASSRPEATRQLTRELISTISAVRSSRHTPMARSWSQPTRSRTAGPARPTSGRTRMPIVLTRALAPIAAASSLHHHPRQHLHGALLHPLPARPQVQEELAVAFHAFDGGRAGAGHDEARLRLGRYRHV